MTSKRRQRLTALAGAGVIAAMLGLTAASVPLYNLFCKATGYGGTTRVATRTPGTAPASDVQVTVQFNADTDAKLPWRFRPKQREVTVALGQQQLAFFEAENRGDGPVVGRAVYNVTPFAVGSFFDKIACFCFDEQTLEAGQKVDMPVSFYVDPAMLDDYEAKGVRQITLSYTFYLDEAATKALRERRGPRPTS